MHDQLTIGGVVFNSRLITGTGKFPSPQLMRDALEESGTEMVTVALRRVNFEDPGDNILASIDFSRWTILPNTSGARNAEEAVRLAGIARALGRTDWIKLEVTPDPKYLLPDGEETLKAARILAGEGYKVMPYINADFILAKKLEEAGVVSVMPLGSPIGSNQGLKTLEMLKIIIRESRVPVIVDAGIGSPSDAAQAMEIGADAVLVNTAIAAARDPVIMARAFKNAVLAGRMAYISGFAPKQDTASPSSSFEWISRI